MLGGVSGLHSSPHRGSSVEFAEYRKYVPGDDLRRLDWRVYGRTDRYFVKEFEADTNLRCVLVIDASGSMGVTTNGVSKLDFSLQLAASFAYLLVAQGDAVGLTWFSDNAMNSIPSKRSPAQLKAVFDTMEHLRPGGDSQVASLLHEIAETVRQRALILVFSDFLADPEILKPSLEHLRFRKHDVSIFHFLNRDEIDFPFQRPTRFEDLEGGPPIFAEPSDIAARYQTAVAKYLSDLRTHALQTATDYRLVTQEEPAESILRAFLVERVGGGRRE